MIQRDAERGYTPIKVILDMEELIAHRKGAVELDGVVPAFEGEKGNDASLSRRSEAGR